MKILIIIIKYLEDISKLFKYYIWKKDKDNYFYYGDIFISIVVIYYFEGKLKGKICENIK